MIDYWAAGIRGEGLQFSVEDLELVNTYVWILCLYNGKYWYKKDCQFMVKKLKEAL